MNTSWRGALAFDQNVTYRRLLPLASQLSGFCVGEEREKRREEEERRRGDELRNLKDTKMDVCDLTPAVHLVRLESCCDRTDGASAVHQTQRHSGVRGTALAVAVVVVVAEVAVVCRACSCGTMETRDDVVLVCRSCRS